MKSATTRRSPGRPRKSGEKDQHTEQEILRAASSAFMQSGYEKVSLDQIARTCGVTKATVYYYFANKANLFTLSIVRMFAAIRGHIDRLLGVDAPLKERLRALAKGQMATPHSEFETLMAEARSHLSREQIAMIRDAELSIHERMAEEFAGAIERGEMRLAPPMMLSMAFASMLMMGRRETMLSLHDGDLDRVAAAVVDLFWHGAKSS